MAYAQHAGLANPSCQLYMLFYYIGPALAGFTLRCGGRNDGGCDGGRSRHRGSGTRTISSSTKNYYDYGATTSTSQNMEKDILDGNNCCIDVKDVVVLDVDDTVDIDEDDDERLWPSRPLVIKASLIALFDIFAQSMVYTGKCAYIVVAAPNVPLKNGR